MALDPMNGMITSYLASPKGQEMLKNFLSSPEGQKAICEYAASSRGKPVIAKLLPDLLQRLQVSPQTCAMVSQELQNR